MIHLNFKYITEESSDTASPPSLVHSILPSITMLVLTFPPRKLCPRYPPIPLSLLHSSFGRSHSALYTDIFVDNIHIELSLWDTAGQEEFDRLRSLSYDDTHTIMLCFSVDSKDSLENIESKWVGEIAENCAGVKLVLVALKCDLRTNGADEEDEEVGSNGRGKEMIDYKQGLEVAKRIQALRYLGGCYAEGRTDCWLTV